MNIWDTGVIVVAVILGIIAIWYILVLSTKKFYIENEKLVIQSYGGKLTYELDKITDVTFNFHFFRYIRYIISIKYKGQWLELIPMYTDNLRKDLATFVKYQQAKYPNTKIDSRILNLVNNPNDSDWLKLLTGHSGKVRKSLVYISVATVILFIIFAVYTLNN